MHKSGQAVFKNGKEDVRQRIKGESRNERSSNLRRVKRDDCTNGPTNKQNRRQKQIQKAKKHK